MRSAVRQAGRLILIDPDEAGREMLADRLRMQGYTVTAAGAPAEGAVTALSSPPSAVIADLWMPSISGVQLCRLLKAEPATETVPVVLRGPDDQRNRFWAERAGASGYVVKGRMGDLMRNLSRVIRAAPPSDDFFIHLSGEGAEIRDRIAAYLDQALFESVIAAEVRALSVCGEFTRLFDLFTQFLCQVMSYRWVALTTDSPARFALHTHPSRRARAETEARAALAVPAECPVTMVEDQDALAAELGPDPVVHDIQFVDLPLGRLALAPRAPLEGYDHTLVQVIARELGGPIRMTSLVEEAQRLATVDALTTLLNRRAFLAALDLELERSRRLGYPLTLVLLDVDHFKHINDHYGHAAGDAVLAEVGRLLGRQLRKVDLIARWGGEEFVAALSGTAQQDGLMVAERLRARLESLTVRATDGTPIAVTASFGVAQWDGNEKADAVIDRADRAMYTAKHNGRNRVDVLAAPLSPAHTVSA
jgi:two-component system cell cycle response regulator